MEENNMLRKKPKPVLYRESGMEFDPNAGLHRVYDWKPYTLHRIRRILKGLDMRMETIWPVSYTHLPLKY